MATIKQLIPIYDTSISGIPITPTEAGYLAGSIAGTVTSNNCVVVNANKDITSGLNILAAPVVSIAGVLTANTIKFGDNAATISGGTANGYTLDNVILTEFIFGNAIDRTTTLSGNIFYLPSSYTLKTYTDAQVATAAAPKIIEAGGLDGIPGRASELIVYCDREIGLGSIRVYFRSIILDKISPTGRLEDRKLLVANRHITAYLCEPNKVNVLGGRLSNIYDAGWQYIWVVHNSTTNVTGIISSSEYKYTYPSALNSSLSAYLPGFDYIACISAVKFRGTQGNVYPFYQTSGSYRWHTQEHPEPVYEQPAFYPILTTLTSSNSSANTWNTISFPTNTWIPPAKLLVEKVNFTIACKWQNNIALSCAPLVPEFIHCERRADTTINILNGLSVTNTIRSLTNCSISLNETENYVYCYYTVGTDQYIQLYINGFEFKGGQI